MQALKVWGSRAKLARVRAFADCGFAFQFVKRRCHVRKRRRKIRPTVLKRWDGGNPSHLPVPRRR
jgi:hypothetical protein